MFRSSCCRMKESPSIDTLQTRRASSDLRGMYELRLQYQVADLSAMLIRYSGKAMAGKSRVTLC